MTPSEMDEITRVATAPVYPGPTPPAPEWVMSVPMRVTREAVDVLMRAALIDASRWADEVHTTLRPKGVELIEEVVARGGKIAILPKAAGAFTHPEAVELDLDRLLEGIAAAVRMGMVVPAAGSGGTIVVADPETAAAVVQLALFGTVRY